MRQFVNIGYSGGSYRTCLYVDNVHKSTAYFEVNFTGTEYTSKWNTRRIRDKWVRKWMAGKIEAKTSDEHNVVVGAVTD